jgi:lysophospholipase L1-like esterase
LSDCASSGIFEFRFNEVTVRIEMREIKPTVPVGIFLLVILSSLVSAEVGKDQGEWVSAWSTAVHTPLPFPGLPPAPVFENQTVRMVVRTGIGGQRLRIRFSNAYGSTPLEVGAAHVALTDHGSSIVAGSDHALTFGGRPSVAIPTGAPILSDSVEMKVAPFTEISISIYLPYSTPTSTTHFWAQHDTYISGPGDFTSQSEIANPTEKKSWYFLSDLEVWSGDQTRAVIALGDSITDGVGAKQGEYSDWPDQLAKRLALNGGAPSLAVLNEGIGGNRILYDGAGINALARFDRDVLAQPGVRDIILLEGINDIGWPHMKLPPSKDGAAPRPSPFAAQGVTADDLIAGMQQIVDRAHEHHIRVFGATLTPYEGADYFSEDGEQVRQAVNHWIRTSGAFDGVVDFDVAVRDPNHPAQFREGYHSGDHLHPSVIGYKAMADAVDLALLQVSGR